MVRSLADRTFQLRREFEASIAAGKTYDEAVAAGRYKHARAEQAFEEAVAKQKAMFCLSLLTSG